MKIERKEMQKNNMFLLSCFIYSVYINVRLFVLPIKLLMHLFSMPCQAQIRFSTLLNELVLNDLARLAALLSNSPVICSCLARQLIESP